MAARWITINPPTLSTQREITIDGITYRATYYPPCGISGYWTVRDSSVQDLDGQDDNDWYCASWREVVASVDAMARKRKAATS